MIEDFDTGDIRRDVGGIVDEGLKAPKRQSGCLIASQSDNRQSPSTSVGMREGQSPGSIASQSERLLTEERSSGGKRRDADASNRAKPWEHFLQKKRFNFYSICNIIKNEKV